MPGRDDAGCVELLPLIVSQLGRLVPPLGRSRAKRQTSAPLLPVTTPAIDQTPQQREHVGPPENLAEDDETAAAMALR